jgi:energy-coupling factor transporter ATP-binding protein EcfA2
MFGLIWNNQIDGVLGATDDAQEDQLKVLMLGASGTGKSTLTKQMEVTLLRFPPYSRESYQEIILGNVSATVQTIRRGLLRIMEYWDGTVRIPGKPGEMSDDTIEAIRSHISRQSNYPGLQQACHDIRPLWVLPEVREAAREVMNIFRETIFDTALDSAT